MARRLPRVPNRPSPKCLERRGFERCPVPRVGSIRGIDGFTATCNPGPYPVYWPRDDVPPAHGPFDGFPSRYRGGGSAPADGSGGRGRVEVAAHDSADDSPGRDLDRLDRGLPRPRPDDPQETTDRRRLLSTQRPFPLDHPDGGRCPRLATGGSADPDRLRAPPGGLPAHRGGAVVVRGIPRRVRGCPWSCGRRSCCRGGLPSNPHGWPAPAVSRSSSSCDAHPRCSWASYQQSCC